MNYLNTSADLDALVADIGESRIVMLGEASHGTHEYYTWRREISRRLIMEKGFRFIAVEGDWPDCYRINRYIKNNDGSGEGMPGVLELFERWPTWMWGNWEVAALGEWLKDYNRGKSFSEMVGFYGLDVYSLWDSMREILDHLQQEDPDLVPSVKKAMNCFQPFEENEVAYARFSLSGHSCRDKVLALLKELRYKYREADGDPEAGFSAEQNALVAVNAEKYFSTMMSFDNESWNIRDRHMMETLNRLLDFHGNRSRAIVWAHNTHIGDARETDMKRGGMINLGQLAREQYGNGQVYLVGFASHSGNVMAGSEWGAPMEVMNMPEARNDSLEHLLHRQHAKDGYLLMRHPANAAALQEPLPHRAIGVVYNPEFDSYRNYVPSVIARRYDALVYLDETSALHPVGTRSAPGVVPDSYPSGF